MLLDVGVSYGGSLVPPLGDGILIWVSLCSVVGQFLNTDSVASERHARVVRSDRSENHYPWICPCKPIVTR